MPFLLYRNILTRINLSSVGGRRIEYLVKINAEVGERDTFYVI